ncbi:MAG TPA: 50S ribosomal protein L11 methyltransferase [Dissulfurispiraceae bacterium]|nr:50S ribosomal protein L11 methyltransferase [Dissulfurispiraceae bacterium]
MSYYEFIFDVVPEAAEALTQLLSDRGCLGVYEREHRLFSYFPDSMGIESIRKMAAESSLAIMSSGLQSDLRYSYTYLSERDWNETWKKKFQPIDVGDTLTVIPPWETAPEGRIPIIIDPGMAFGTGHHETTRFCLAAIEMLSGRTPQGRFCDIGTGTGILAIAARKLGFADATGVDIDPLAVDAARRNVRLNELDNVMIYEGSVEKTSGPFDLIAANLLSEILKALAPEIVVRMKPESLALLSGIMIGQEDEIIEVFSALGATVEEKLIDGRWISLVIRR